MARNRTPLAVARVTGDTIKHPERFADRADPPVSALGNPPTRLNAAEKKAWKSFAEEMPWLVASDRKLVELASRLTVYVGQPDCPLGIYAQLRLCLSSMGGTPVDRSRVQWAEDDPDPASEFLN